ncbi:MAG: hypothetical protein K0S55_330 [Clostridia bacterium]|nr:hypothetical protein [Clostridia bacterium]
MDSTLLYKRHKHVKLIFNPLSGKSKESSVQLMDVIKEMQSLMIIPEPFLIEPGCDLDDVVKDSVAKGYRMIIACGGDGTISSVARSIVNTNANVTLGVIPTGTRNNVALSLGIPADISAAIALLRTGRRLKFDIGLCKCKEAKTPFIEVCSIGLFSKLFSAGDDIQHGKIMRIGDFIETFVTTPPSEIRLTLDDKREVNQLGHVVLISNTPYVGINNKVSSPNCFRDGYLDVLVLANQSKTDLIGNVLKGSLTNHQEDPRIQHYRVRKVTVDTKPAMTVMADSVTIGEGFVLIEVQKHALTVMSPSLAAKGESLEN